MAETSRARKKKSSMTIHTVFQSNTTSVKKLWQLEPSLMIKSRERRLYQ
jgi:hypothetical protein